MAAAESLHPPRAYVTAAPDSEGHLDIISDPTAEPDQLSTPGAALVLRASRPGEIRVGLRRTTEGGSLEATFRLEALGKDDGNARPREAAAAPPAAFASRPADISFLAHVAMRGDVLCERGAWVGGPAAPASIEGLEFRSSDPDGLRIDAQILTRNGASRWSDWASSGTFIGTRGRRQPILGLRLRLRGIEAVRFDLEVEALFLGAPASFGAGAEIEFVGPGGADPLVGLRVNLKSRVQAFTNRRGEPPRRGNPASAIG